MRKPKSGFYCTEFVVWHVWVVMCGSCWECRTTVKRGDQPRRKFIGEITEVVVIQGESKKAEKTNDRTMGTFAYKGQV